METRWRSFRHTQVVVIAVTREEDMVAVGVNERREVGVECDRGLAAGELTLAEVFATKAKAAHAIKINSKVAVNPTLTAPIRALPEPIKPAVRKPLYNKSAMKRHATVTAAASPARIALR
jgi:hypothetical protein